MSGIVAYINYERNLNLFKLNLLIQVIMHTVNTNKWNNIKNIKRRNKTTTMTQIKNITFCLKWCNNLGVCLVKGGVKHF